MRLKNKVAIVTGAASGMGKAIAELYAKEGAKVVVSDYNLEGAQLVADTINSNGGSAVANRANVADSNDLDAMFKVAIDTFGKLDILVNNAGIMDGMEPVGEITDERWDRVFSVNTRAVMQSMRIATNLFLEQGHGVIVNNISVGGLYGSRAGAAYVASKHAVSGLTKNTGYMYANSGIRCNGIAPGGVETNISTTMTNMSQFGAGRVHAGAGNNPRTGKPEEIAEIALFLASDESRFVNGQIITGDAGWTAY